MNSDGTIVSSTSYSSENIKLTIMKLYEFDNFRKKNQLRNTTYTFWYFSSCLSLRTCRGQTMIYIGTHFDGKKCPRSKHYYSLSHSGSFCAKTESRPNGYSRLNTKTRIIFQRFQKLIFNQSQCHRYSGMYE